MVGSSRKRSSVAATTELFARRATLSRSLRLLSEFRFEQRDPARFYGALAQDTAAMVTDLWRSANGTSPTGRTLLDVGGGPGYFAAAFADAGIDYIGVEPDASEMHAWPAATDGAATYVRASGTALPFADASVDICLSSNVAEHVAAPWRLGREMLRVTKPGGLAVLSYTVWLGPFGGHEMGLSHYLGGARGVSALCPQARPSTKEQLRVITVRGVGRRRPGMGRRHRCTGRRISPLPPAMGLVDGECAGAQGGPGEQLGAGLAPTIIRRLKQVLVLRLPR